MPGGIAELLLRAVADYEVVLLRHGETHGYEGDRGLTDRGRQQAHERGSALAAELAPGATVRMPHARTARASETAAVVRAALVADRAAERPLDLGPTYPEPWLDNLRVSVDGVGVEAGTAVGDRLALDGELPGWAVECDRFDRGYGPSKAAGGPIQYWLRNPMLYFEPPQVAAYRVWRGIISAGASGPDRLVVIASTHSAPMRAFAATAFGRDLGEPDHLEGVRILVHGDHAVATIRYRDLEIEAALPAQLPPWIDREWLEPSPIAE